MLSDCCKSADNDKVDAVAVQDINDGCCMQGLRTLGQFTPTDRLRVSPRLDLSILCRRSLGLRLESSP